MNKVAVAGVSVVVIVAAAWAGATAWSGQQAETRYREQIVRAQARLPFLRVIDEKYSKGFLSSTSTTTLQFGCSVAGTEAPATTATIASTVHHGPLAGGRLAAAVIDSQLRIAGAQLQPLVDAFGGVPLTIRTVVGFAGTATSTFESPAAKLTLGKGGELAWQGLSGTIESSKDARSAVYHLRGPGLTVTDPASHGFVRVGAFALDGDGRATSDSGLVTIGKVQGTLDAIEMADGNAADPFRIVLTGMKVSSSTSLDGELVGGTGTFSGAGSFGDVKVDRFDMQSSMHRLHAPTYQHLMETATKEIYRCDSKDKMADLLGLQDKLKDDLVALLRYGPQVSLDKLAVQSGGLTGELAYAVGVDGVTEADAKLPAVALLMTHAKASASARFPVEWLRKMSMVSTARLQGKAADPATFDLMLGQVQAQGLVVRDGDFVTSRMEFANGVLKVNGKVMGPGADASGAAPR